MPGTARQVYRIDKLELLRGQNGLCGMCGIFLNVEEFDDYHILPKHAGGLDLLDNRLLVHRWCHQACHQRVGYKSLKA